jgi:pimeloyl-ACP methyl ester carboxylesterase
MRRYLPPLLLLALLLSLVYALGPGGRRLAESIELVADVWGLGGAPPRRGAQGVMYAGPGDARRSADLYCDPAAPVETRLLLVHGLVEAGKYDARLEALGAALARHRFLVLVPDFPGMKALRVGREDIEEVRRALAALEKYDHCPGGEAPPRGSPPATLGAVGFSYSSGPVLLAIDTRPSPVDFAVLFGGYDDLVEVIRFLTTGRFRDEGREREGEALLEGRWIVLGANANAFPDPADREALRAISIRRRADPAAGIADLASRLGPAARSALDLLANTDPGRFDALLARIDPGLRALLDDLSPARRLAQPIGADLYLLHGRSDAIVPYTQSLALARTVRATGTVRLALLGGFRHARPLGKGVPGWLATLEHPGDSIRLVGILSELLAYRERPSAAGRAAPPNGRP